MLQNLKHLYGRHLDALDGEIGQVKDFVFDDRTWTIRYVLAETGTWLATQRVLLETQAFVGPLIGTPRRGAVSARVNLTRAQIEAKPAIPPFSLPAATGAAPPEARPDYWSGDGLWSGASGPPREVGFSTDPVAPAAGARPDPHLHSTMSLTGCRVLATDLPFGTVVGFMADGDTWAIRQVIVETGAWYASESFLLRPEQIARIRIADSTVWLKMPADAYRPSSGRVAPPPPSTVR